ncbi:MAG TPA: hypothetical protein VK603_12930 [Candidatus Saccharimonadales bacterium]|nr:hypothetical protein [Candidatus Saccharimonadales bacterium]
MAFLIKFDRVGKIVVRAERGIGCWLMAGNRPGFLAALRPTGRSGLKRPSIWRRSI